MTEMTEQEQGWLTEVQSVMTDPEFTVRLELTRVYFNPAHERAVQIYAKPSNGRGAWKKRGPLLFPAEGGTLADTLAMLAAMCEGSDG